MIILIEYNERIVRAEVVKDHTVNMITGVGRFKSITHLDQCRKCGVWCSEDDELYGDGFCTECAEMCFECQRYFNRDTMVPPDESKGEEEYTCKECAKKVKVPEGEE